MRTDPLASTFRLAFQGASVALILFFFGGACGDATANAPLDPNPPVENPEPPLGSTEPSFGDNTSDVLVWQDAFDTYDCSDGCGASVGAAYSHRANPLGLAQSVALVTGRGGNGQAIEMRYGEDFAHDIVLEKATGGSAHFFFQIHFRTSVGWDPSSHRTDGVKGFMFFHDGATQRFQHPVHKLRKNPDCSSNGAWDQTHFGYDLGRSAIGGPYCAGFVWEGRVSDSEPVPWYGRAGTAFATPLNDGQWHRVTIEIKSATGPQYHRVWVDGVLAWDDSAADLSYPTPQLASFFGNYAVETGAEPGTIAFDDYVMWHR